MTRPWLGMKSAIAVAAMAGSTSACSTEAGTSRAAGAEAALAEVRDSLGIEIVTTPGAQARASSGWRVEDDPDLVIGRDDHGDYQFDNIRNARRLADGRILVVDGGSAEARIYEADGAFAFRLGGRGEGPGEFQAPLLVPGTAAGPFLLFDGRLNRFTSLDPGTGRAETVTPPSRVQGTPIGRVGDRVLMQSAAIVLRMGATEGAEPVTPAHFSLVDPAGGTADTVAVLEGLQQFRIVRNAGGPATVTMVPFRIVPSAVVGPGGFFLHAAKEPEILRMDADGNLVGIVRIGEPPQRVTPDVLAEAARREGELSTRDPAGLLADFERMPLPDLVPAFRRLVLDDLGWLWAEVYRPGDLPLVVLQATTAPSDWLLFDPDGRGRGHVRTPPSFHLEQAGADWVLGIHVDALGVQTVRRHPLWRGG